jgi:hypothetical protein
MHAGILGHPRQFIAVMGKQGLVGGDQMLAVPERRSRELKRYAVGTADQFADHIDVGVFGQARGMVIPFECGDIAATSARALLGAYGDHLKALAASALQQVALLLEQLQNTATDHTKSGQTNSKGLAHSRSSGSYFKLKINFNHMK